MRVLFINSVCGVGSTGRICCDLAREYKAQGHEVKIAYGRKSKVPDDIDTIKIGNELEQYMHVAATRLLDEHGFWSSEGTKKFLKKAEEFKPDLLWLHNIHGYYINVEMLFAWIKRHPEMKVKWTLHDCWTFTGHCAFFTYGKCNKWIEQCRNCPNKHSYPESILFEQSKRNYERKKKAFTGVKNLELVTPSKWLADLTRNSFLAKYPVEIKYNTVNEQVFYPGKSNFKQEYGIEDKFMILGVANYWSKRKGFGDFIELAKALPEDCVIVLVGVSDKQKKLLPPNCIGIHRTSNVEELVGLYRAADCFFNPTYEDNYPTVNLEARNCGTYIYSYDTGGCSETFQKGEGTILQVGDWKSLVEIINKNMWKSSAVPNVIR